MLSYYNSVKQLEESGVDTAIIPIGSIEQHGSHLPIGVDYFTAMAYSEAVAEKINALLYPPIPFSTCYEHKGTKGTLGMRPSTLYNVIEELALGLRDQGINKIIFIVGHGGAFIIGPAVRELNALYDDLKVLFIYGTVESRAKEVLENKEAEIHAGEKETSLMMYLHPETVDTEEMKKNDFIPDLPREFMNYAPLCEISPTGVWGKPSLASAEKGKKIFDYTVEAMVEYIRKAFDIAPSGKW